MKIERINENQIRCTLTGQDLAERQMKLSELAYGSDKAKRLFHEMMQKANYELGFDAEDIPLMIEAIPLSGGAILLNVTKIEYPEELDTRFSNFTPVDADSQLAMDDDLSALSIEAADSILDLFRHLGEAAGIRPTETEKEKKDRFVPLHETAKSTATKKPAAPTPLDQTQTVPADIVKLFCFRDLSHLLRLSKLLTGFYFGKNTLYTDHHTKLYYLIIHKSDHTPSEFNKVCNILSEYGVQHPFYDSAKAFFDEHFSLIAKDHELEYLAKSVS